MFVTKDLTKDASDCDENYDKDDEEMHEIRPSQLDNYFDSGHKAQKVYLLVKSRNFQDYSKAVMLVQELLINVYEDYKRFCEKVHKKPVCGGLIKKTEMIKGDRRTVTRVINT